METSMYYTFSTISQVLAAFIALSGVFLIFKIQEFKKMQIVHAKYFYDFIDIDSDNDIRDFVIRSLKRAIESEKLNEIFQIIDMILSDKNHPIIEPEKLKLCYLIKEIEDAKIRLLKLAKISMISGVATIIISLTTLSLVHWIKNYSSISALLLIIALIGAFTSIIYMIKSIFRALTIEVIISSKFEKLFMTFKLKLSRRNKQMLFFIQAFFTLLLNYPTQWQRTWENLREDYHKKFKMNQTAN